MKTLVLVVATLFAFTPTLALSQIFGNVHRVVYPQIAYGGGWTTTILATNVSDTKAQVTYGFKAQDGSDLQVPIVRRSGELYFTSVYNPSDIPPKSSWTNVLRSTDQKITVGFMTAMVDMVGGKDTIQVQVTYSYSDPDGNLESQAAVFPATLSRYSGLQIVRGNLASDIGVAIANINWVPAEVNIRVHNMAGQVVASIDFTVPTKGQIAKFITELEPQLKTSWGGGLVEVRSNQDIAVMSVLMTGPRFSSGTTF